MLTDKKAIMKYMPYPSEEHSTPQKNAYLSRKNMEKCSKKQKKCVVFGHTC